MNKTGTGRKKGSIVIYRKNYNLLGERFGKVVVVEKLENRYITPSGKSQVQWRCICDCGKEKIATTNNLCMGNSSSCGCMSFTPEVIERRAKGLIKELAGFTEVLGSYKRNAKKRGYNFSLNDEESMSLFKGNCYYCGIEPKMIIKKSKIPFIYNGIDRKNNFIGYEYLNCVSCCGRCNKAKMNLPMEDFINLITKIYKNLIDNK